MKSRLGYIFIALAMLAGVSSYAQSSSQMLRVKILQPEPNYPLTKDPGDAAQLTDGQLNSFPFWKQRDSVGWQQRTPVRITLQATMQSNAYHRLTIRTANRNRAGVHPPRRVDIYCGDGVGDGMRHVAEFNPEKAYFERDGMKDLTIPFLGCRGGILDVILHAEGQYLMLDEISLSSGNAAGILPPVASAVARVANNAGVYPMEDSLTRLAQELRKLAPGPSLPPGAARRGAWLASPWEDIGDEDAGSHLDVLSLPTAGAVYVVGIRNTTSKSQRHGIRLDPNIVGIAGISRLRAVLSANGVTALDALKTSGDSAWTIPAGETLHLLIQEPQGAASGTRIHRVIDGRGGEIKLRVHVTLLDLIQPSNTDWPQVNVWAYTNDKPIWRQGNKERLMDELGRAGVNIHLVATRNIPMPFPPASLENEMRLRAMSEDVRLYKGRGQILLYTGQKLWDQIKESLHRPETEKVLRYWVGNLAKLMEEQGVSPAQWALYLVDEPRNEDLELLARVIPLLRKEVPQLRFYANPIPGRGIHAIESGSIRALGGLVDYWQPRAGVAHEIVRGTLQDSARSQIWLYDNPCPPAKSVSPSWYRGLARRALDSGAHGFGFWSFSATNNSSAWDDLDGHRADWAVVYEAENGFVSSRRWEAFKQGVKDYAALRYCKGFAGTNTALAAQCDLLRDATIAREVKCVE